MYKCGYCGWVLNSQCEDITLHDCFLKHFKRDEHDICVDDQNRVHIFAKNAIGTATDPLAIMETAAATEPAATTKAATTEPASEEKDEKQIFEENLISAVFARRPLWDHSISVKLRSTLIVKELWQEICLSFGEKYPVEFLKKRWRQLRDEYTRSKKKVKTYVPSGSGAEATPKKSSFRFFEVLAFLDDIGEKAPSQSNVPAPALSIDADELVSPAQMMSPASDLLSPTPSTSSQSETTSRKRKQQSDINCQLQEAIAASLSEKPIQQDAVDGFLMMIGDSLRRLPYRTRSRTQIKILQLIQEAEDEES